MPHAQRHRGAHPEDARLFGPAALPILSGAAAELVYLLSRGYPPDPALSFVGGHHQLDARQRLALRRMVCSDEKWASRAARRLPLSQAAQGTVHIDGFNLIITLEVALSGGVLLKGRDGALRDLAGLRGSYHPVVETEEALRRLGEGLSALNAKEVQLLLDAPVSNSGRLRARVLHHAAAWPFALEVLLLSDVDRTLAGKERVVSSDAMVLDTCASWLNLAPFLIASGLRSNKEAWLVELADLDPHLRT
jgi:hypothetical protein